MYKIALLLILISFRVFPQNARAILNIVDEVEELTVGETYSLKLTVVPFSIDSLTKDIFENKTFLDYFYVTKVERLFVSENNEEAVVVNMKAILSKNFKPKPLYIWNLVDRNIPVEMESFGVRQVQGQLQDFVVQKTGQGLERDSSWQMIGVSIVALVFLGFLIYLKFRRKKLSPEQIREEELQLIIQNAENHEHFEEIYRKRNSFYETYKDKEGFRDRFASFLELYRIEQFSTKWRTSNLDKIIEAKNSLFKGEEIGS